MVQPDMLTVDDTRRAALAARRRVPALHFPRDCPISIWSSPAIGAWRTLARLLPRWMSPSTPTFRQDMAGNPPTWRTASCDAWRQASQGSRSRTPRANRRLPSMIYPSPSHALGPLGRRSIDRALGCFWLHELSASTWATPIRSGNPFDD